MAVEAAPALSLLASPALAAPTHPSVCPSCPTAGSSNTTSKPLASSVSTPPLASTTAACTRKEGRQTHVHGVKAWVGGEDMRQHTAAQPQLAGHGAARARKPVMLLVGFEGSPATQGCMFLFLQGSIPGTP